MGKCWSAVGEGILFILYTTHSLTYTVCNGTHLDRNPFNKKAKVVVVGEKGEGG